VVGFEEFKKHKEIVESRLREYISEPSIWNKYLWVANYHNWFCTQTTFFDESYRIDLGKIPVGPTRIV